MLEWWRKHCGTLKDPYKKWRNEHILFLDDAFDCKQAYEMLKAEGFQVERFSSVFTTDVGTRAQSVKDPVVIRHCNSGGYILLTCDGDIIKRHRLIIEKAPSLGILATAHNMVADIEVWVRAFIALRSLIEQNSFRKRHRPWFGRFNTQGRISTPIRYVGLGAQAERRPPEKSHGVRSLIVSDAKTIGPA
jgi:hypothetical protein